MADDIDIEEHDVLENPVIKQMFPDISQLKAEIQDYEAAPDDFEEASVDILSAQSTLPQEIEANSLSSTGNLTHNVLVEPPLSPKPIVIRPIETNKIIVGTKRPKLEKEKTLKIVLDDVFRYLNSNERFCKICLRLFRKKSELIAHSSCHVIDNNLESNSTAYTQTKRIKLEFLEDEFIEDSHIDKKTKNAKPLKQNNDINKTSQTNIKGNIDKKSKNTVPLKPNKSQKISKPTINDCFHCSTKFLTTDALIKHLYDVLQQEKVFEGNNVNQMTKFEDEINILKKIKKAEPRLQVVAKRTKIETVSTGKVKMLKNIQNSEPNRQVVAKGTRKETVSTRRKISTNNNSLRDSKANNSKRKTRNEIKLDKAGNTPGPYSLRNVSKQINISKINEICIPDLRNNTPDEITIISDKNKILSKLSEKEGINTIEETKMLYRCRICFQYLRNITVYGYHMRKRHNLTKYSKPRREKFNPFCKYCSIKRVTLQAYNTHLLIYHKKQVVQERKKISDRSKAVSKKKYVDCKMKPKKPTASIIRQSIIDSEPEVEYMSITSVFYQCIKCDIYFTSLQEAINHTGHMELLINWKCPTCNKNFKENDKDLHIQQHLYFEEFQVNEVDENILAKFLYKCLKCGIHFGECNFLKHYPKCEFVNPESGYCNQCDILVEKYLKQSHEFSHKLEDMKPGDFIFIEAKVVVIKCLKSLKEKNISKEKKTVNKYTFKRGMKIPDSVYTMYHCDICNLFITTRHKTHLESHCKHLTLVNYICRYCGLNLTQKSIIGHRRMHMKYPFIKLENILFYDLRTLKPIQPPIPKYRKCDCCDVYFEDKSVKDHHICSEVKHETCHICNIKLSEKAFTLHMGFHDYLMKNAPKQSNLNLQQSEAVLNEKSCLNNNTSTDNILETEKKSKDTQVLFEDCNSLLDTELELNKSKEETKRSETPLHSKESEQTKSCETPLETKESGQTKRSETPLETKELTQEKIHKRNTENITSNQSGNTFRERSILYKCLSCLLVVETYDKVVEHCQAHYTKQDTSTQREKCVPCDMVFDKSSFVNHRKLHNNVDFDKTSLRVLNFEHFYFSFSDEVWFQNLFQSVTKEEVKYITENALYNHYRRLKLELLQDGPSKLTVYKCHKCNVFHDASNVMKHAQSPCLLVRKKFPCQSCGLPFSSLPNLKEHKKIHKINKITSLKSYRIVLFNKEQNQNENEILASLTPMCYVLFQCRNCSIIVEKSKKESHNCNNIIEIQCTVCCLHIDHSIYEEHCKKHKQFPSFCQRNMKLVLFGRKTKTKYISYTKAVDFKGAICEYTMFKCMKCLVCVDTKEGHVCLFGVHNKSTCPICEEYVLLSDLNKHDNMHKQDPGFIKDYLEIIEFNVEKQTVKKEDFVSSKHTVVKGIDKSKSNSRKRNNKDFELNISEDAAKEKSVDTSNEIAKIYKCTCGLNFLNDSSFESHFKTCSPKVRTSKQTCPKCSLLFTPSILFNHLIMHHGNKKQFTFHIIEKTTSTDSSWSLYKCDKCSLHLVTKSDAFKHYKNCDVNDENKGVLCEFCNLRFDETSYNIHLVTHQAENEHDLKFDITSICDLQKDKVQITRNRKSKAKGTYVMDEEALRKINMSVYDNKIYKCVLCNLYFLKFSTLETHCVKMEHLSASSCDICNVCGLNFSAQSLTKHVYIHHEKLKLKLSDFIIKEYDEFGKCKQQ